MGEGINLVSCLGPKAWSWNTMFQGRTFQAWSQVWEDTWKSMGVGGYAEQFNSIKTLGERESYDWQEMPRSAMAARLGVESWGLCSSIWTEGLNICIYLYKCAGLYPWNDGHNDDMMMTANIYWVLMRVRPSSQCFTCSISLNSPNNPMMERRGANIRLFILEHSEAKRNRRRKHQTINAAT